MSTKTKLMLVAGARPNFMKIAPVLREIARRSDAFEHVLVHTGQHYDEGMSDVFFRDLAIPAPDHYLNVGSASHAQQTAKIMTEFEPVLEAEKPACVLVFGDVNSTLACSIVAKKLNFPVAHVEAGLRSGDMTMPEEVNRIVTDSITDYFFVTEPSGIQHLKAEGKTDEQVFHVGHVMIDNLFFEVERLKAAQGQTFGTSAWVAKNPRFGVVTLHRPSNVDQQSSLEGIIGALAQISERLPLIFPVHPRTRSRMDAFGIDVPPAITLTEPLGYREFLNLWKDASIVVTDSGGLQEETTALAIPCITLRENTERPVTVDEGTNQLVGCDPARILAAADSVLDSKIEGRRPKFWDGQASERILDILSAKLAPALAGR